MLLVIESLFRVGNSDLLPVVFVLSIPGVVLVIDLEEVVVLIDQEELGAPAHMKGFVLVQVRILAGEAPSDLAVHQGEADDLAVD